MSHQVWQAWTSGNSMGWFTFLIFSGGSFKPAWRDEVSFSGAWKMPGGTKSYILVSLTKCLTFESGILSWVAIGNAVLHNTLHTKGGFDASELRRFKSTVSDHQTGD